MKYDVYVIDTDFDVRRSTNGDYDIMIFEVM